MSKIIKGTTPSILLDFDEFPLDVHDIVKISMIIQHGQKEWDVTDDIAFNREELQAVYHFSQSQTLALSQNHEIYFEVDALHRFGKGAD